MKLAWSISGRGTTQRGPRRSFFTQHSDTTTRSASISAILLPIYTSCIVPTAHRDIEQHMLRLLFSREKNFVWERRRRIAFYLLVTQPPDLSHLSSLAWYFFSVSYYLRLKYIRLFETNYVCVITFFHFFVVGYKKYIHLFLVNSLLTKMSFSYIHKC